MVAFDHQEMRRHLAVIPLLGVIAFSCSVVSIASPPELEADGHSLATAELSPEDEAAGHFVKGKLLLFERDLDAALEEFRLAAQKDPSQAYLRHQVAVLCIQKSLFEEALQEAERARDLEPGNVSYRLLLAGLYLANGRDSKAMEEYAKVIELDQRNQEAYLTLGVLEAQKERFDQAIEILRRFASISPGSPIGHQYLGRVLWQSGDAEEGEKSLLKAVALAPNSESILLDLGRTYEMAQKKEKAVEVYQRILKINPSQMLARQRLRSLATEEQRAGQRANGPESVGSAVKELTDLQTKFALLEFQKGDYEGAVVALHLALGRNPEDSGARYYLANLYGEAKDTEQAIEQFAKIPFDAESFVAARVQMGMLYQQAGRLNEAIALVQDGLNKKKDDKELLAFLASLYREKKEYQKSIQIFEKLTEINPENDRYHFSLGAVYDESQNKEKSMELMRKAIELNPKNSAALNYLGYTLAEMGVRLDEAEQLVLDALKIRPDDGYYIDSLGWVYYQKGQYQKAVVELERAVELASEDPTILEHLADAYDRTGRRLKALDFYQHSLRGSKDPKQVERIREKMETLQKQLER